MILRRLLALLMLSVTPSFAQKKQDRGFHTDALHAGANEYQFWTGYSPDSVTWLGKSQGRRLFMAGVGWRRVILASNSVAWKFTLDVVPVALLSQPTVVFFQNVTLSDNGNETCGGPQITSETIGDFGGVDFGPCVSTRRRTTYGFIAEPLGFDVNFLRRRRVQPVLGTKGGFAKFTRDVPVPYSNSFNFTFSFRGGIQIFTNEFKSFSVGYQFDHISNANTGHPLNPGIDSNFVYAGYSFVGWPFKH